MDRTAVTSWLAGYVAAWRANDVALIRPLFSDDAVYRYHPFDEPVVGVEVIVDSWLEEPDDPDTWSARYEPVAVDGDMAVAVGTSRYQANGAPWLGHAEELAALIASVAMEGADPVSRAGHRGP